MTETPLQSFQLAQCELLALAWDRLDERELAAFAEIARRMTERLAARLAVREAEGILREAAG